MVLPKHYDPQASEPRWERFWQERGVEVYDMTIEEFMKRLLAQ